VPNLNEKIAEKLGISKAQIVSIDELLYSINSSMPEIVTEMAIDGYAIINPASIRDKILDKVEDFLDEALGLELIEAEEPEMVQESDMSEIEKFLRDISSGFSGFINGKRYDLRNKNEAEEFGKALTKLMSK